MSAPPGSEGQDKQDEQHGHADLKLVRVAYWDELGNGRFHLHIAHPARTETVRALEGEVLRLVINSPAEAPWQGRSPFAMMGGSPRLLAEIEGAVQDALAFVGRGILPFPDTVPEEQQSAALRGLKAGGTLAAVRSRADFTHSTGNPRGQEWRRVDLTPDLEQADLNPTVDSLHNRLMAAAGVPPDMFSASGSASQSREAYRFFTVGTILPLARQLLPELAKIGVTTLSSKSMLSADVAGRARAIGTLVGAGMDLEKALKLVGWSDE